MAMRELVIELPEPLHRQLLAETTEEQLAGGQVLVEALELWLREKRRELLSERERIKCALERTGLLVPPADRYYSKRELVDEASREAKREQVRQILSKLKRPLSEDIIKDRR